MPRPGEKIEKSTDFKGSMKRLIKSLKRWYIGIIIALLLAFFSSIIYLIAPNKLSNLTDTITEGLKPRISETVIEEIMYSDEISIEDKQKMQEIMSTVDTNSTTDELLEAMDELPKSIYDIIKPKMDMEKVKSIALLLAILYIFSSLFSYLEQIIMTYVTNNYSRDLRKQISDKINKLPLRYFDNHETGDILSRVTNDVDSISLNLNRSFGDLISSITLFIGSIIMMFYTNWIMAVTGIVASLIGFAFMGIILSKSQKYFVERQEKLGSLNGYIEEIYSGHNIVYTYNGEKETNKNFDKLNKDLFKCSKMSQFLSGIMPPFMGFVGNLGYVAVCVVGALLTMNNIITFGVIVAFMIYVRMFTNPLNQIAQAATSMQSVAAAAERVFNFTEEQEESDESNITKKLDINDIKGNIEFHNVKFSYDKERPIIKNFSAKVKEGQKVAIVGPTGAGKTTMVNLLMKFYDIDEGEILIDGISTKDLTRENIHDLFVMVLQDTWLFDGTIEDNIRYNNKSSEEEIWNACKIVGIDHFIKTLPGGLKAKVGDQENISSGEKQLLTIARGMIKNSPFLILDEATSNVDTRTEELVQKAMDKLIKGKTSFIIAHRLSTIKNADLILVMNEGNIIEQGTHDELMKKQGFYHDLYNSQFEL
jgi:ATP-binding cassette subfamily B protein